MISFTKSLLENMFRNGLNFNRNRRGGVVTHCCQNTCTFEVLKSFCPNTASTLKVYRIKIELVLNLD